MIKIVGVAHVLNLKNRIYAFIDYEMPDAIAVELDEHRLNALLNGVQKRGGFSVFSILGNIQRRIAEAQNVTPGQEMLAAYEKGRMLDKPVFLIDMDINTTYRKFKNDVRTWEKIKIVFSIFYSIFPVKKSSVSMDDVLNNEREFIEKFRKGYPTFVKVLLDDREDFMAKKLKELDKLGKVIAFVGDGHLEGLKNKIPDAEIIPLKKFLELDIPNTEFRISFRI